MDSNANNMNLSYLWHSYRFARIRPTNIEIAMADSLNP